MNTKFIRKARRKFLVREKAIDVLSKALLIGISVLVCLWMVSGAHAATVSITGIKGQSLNDGSYAIDFSLSQKIDAENVSVEYDRNFIQVSLKGVSAYPARTESINQGSLEKVFTYQYQPDLARARVLLKTAAAALKGKSSWKVTSEGIRITVKGAGSVAQSISDTVKSKAGATSTAETVASSGDADDARIVQQILSDSKSGKPAASLAPPVAVKGEESPLFGDKAAESKPAAAAATVSGEDQALFSAKGADGKGKESGATRVIASLLLVIGVIGACAVAFRRFALGKGMPFQRSNRVIETIATQSLGPKRSVAVIKVLDQYLVVGMAGDGMSLLTNLGSDVKIDKYLDQIGPGSSFSDSLEGALAGVTAAGKTDTAGPPLTHFAMPTSGGALAGALPKAAQIEQGIRSSIKKRLSGFKPL